LIHFEEKAVRETLLELVLHWARMYDLIGESMRKNEEEKSTSLKVYPG